MPDIPQDIIDNQRASFVLARQKSHPSLAGLRTTPGSMVHQTMAPTALETANLYREVQRVIEMTSVLGPPGHRASGNWLDEFVVQRTGQERVGASAAQVPVRFTGTIGTVVPAGYIVSTGGARPIDFALLADAVVGVGGIVDATVQATADFLGSSGNVGLGQITVLTTPIAGLTSVTNLVGPTTTGFDTETDTAYIARYLAFVRDPPNGSNASQYEQWALEVAGIGAAVALTPGEADGPPGSRVDLYIANTDMRAASDELVDAVQQYIAPPRSATVEAETFAVFNANGVSVDASQPDDSGSSQLMQYAAAGQGEIRYQIPQATMVQAGIWTARPSMKVDNAAGITDLVTVEIFDLTTNTLASTRQVGGMPTTWTLTAGDLLLAYTAPVFDFYWNRTDNLEIRVRRLATDLGTSLWVDKVELRSRFSNYDLQGRANATAEVQVLPAIEVPIDIAVSVKLSPTAVAAASEAAISSNYVTYLRQVAYVDDELGGNDVIYGEIGAVTQTSSGVEFYDPASLRVAGATANVIIAKRELAVPGVFSLTELP